MHGQNAKCRWRLDWTTFPEKSTIVRKEKRFANPAGLGAGTCDEEKHGSPFHGGLCDAGEVPERSSAVSPGILLEGPGCGAAAQHHGQLGDPQFPVV